MAAILRHLWEVEYNVAVEVEGSDYVWGRVHCHAGILQPGSNQFLCKVAIHIWESAWNGGYGWGFVGKWYSEEGRKTCLNMLLSVLCYFFFFFLIFLWIQYICTHKDTVVFSPLPSPIILCVFVRNKAQESSRDFLLKHACLEIKASRRLRDHHRVKITTKCTRLECSRCWLARSFPCNPNQGIDDEPCSLRRWLRLSSWNDIMSSEAETLMWLFILLTQEMLFVQLKVTDGEHDNFPCCLTLCGSCGFVRKADFIPSFFVFCVYAW